MTNSQMITIVITLFFSFIFSWASFLCKKDENKIKNEIVSAIFLAAAFVEIFILISKP